MQFPLKLVFSIIFLISFLSSALSAPENLKSKLHTSPDSLKTKLLIDISREYRNINIDSAIYFSNLALSNAMNNAEENNIISANLEASSCYSSKGEFDKALNHLHHANAKAAELNDSVRISRIFYSYGTHYTDVSKYDKAIEYFNKSIALCEKFGDLRTVASNLNGLGIIYWERGDLETAIQKYIAASKIAEKLNATSLKKTLLLNMGIIYADEKQSEKALASYKEVLEIAIKENDKDFMAVIYNNMAILFQEDNDYEDALTYFEKSLKIRTELGDEQGKALALNNIGENYFKVGNIKKAIEHINKSIEINRRLKLETELIYNLESLAKVYLDSGKLQEVNDLLTEGLALCKKLKIKVMQRNFLQLQSEYYYSVGNYKKAYKTFESFNTLKDSLLNASRSDKIAHLQTQFETDKKEKENELLRVKNQYTQEKLDKEKTVTTFLIIFSILSILLLILIVILFRSKVKVNLRIKKINGMLEESNQQLKITNATKDKFFSIIAHDLRSPFNAILGFSELIKHEVNSSNNAEMIGEYNANINESAQSLFTLLENLLQWAKSQRGQLEFYPEQFDLYELIQTNLSIFKLKAADKSIHLYSDIKPNTMAYGDVNMVNTIIRNLISNALKFTEPEGEIKIYATLEDDFVMLKVKDTGIGISNENQDKLFRLDCNYTTYGTNDEAGSGLGLILCKEFVEKNGGNIWVESEENKGSEFIITLKSA